MIRKKGCGVVRIISLVFAAMMFVSTAGCEPTDPGKGEYVYTSIPPNAVRHMSLGYRAGGGAPAVRVTNTGTVGIWAVQFSEHFHSGNPGRMFYLGPGVSFVTAAIDLIASPIMVNGDLKIEVNIEEWDWTPLEWRKLEE